MNALVKELLFHIVLYLACWHGLFAVLAIGALKGADGGPADLGGLYRTYAPAMWGRPTGEWVVLFRNVTLIVFGVAAVSRWMYRRYRGARR